MPQGVSLEPHAPGRGQHCISLSRVQGSEARREPRSLLSQGRFLCKFPARSWGLLQIPSGPAREQSYSASPWIRVFFLDDLFSSEEDSAEAHNSCPFCLQAINSPCLPSSILSLSVQKPELPRENTLGTCRPLLTSVRAE